jgi:integrase
MSARMPRGPVWRRTYPDGRAYGNWIIRYSYRGKEYRESSGSESKAVAKALLRKRLGEQGSGTFTGPATERVAVGELLDDLILSYQRDGRASLRTVRAHVDALRAAGLADRKAVDVTRALVGRIMDEWIAAGTAAATVNKRVATLRLSYSHASKDVQSPKVVVVPSFPRLKEANVRQGFFTRAECEALLAQLPDDGLRDFVAWLSWSGMRKGEASRLEWSMVDRSGEAWTLNVPGEITKNGVPRTLALTGPFRAIIERRHALRRLDTTLIFWRLQDGVPSPCYEFRKTWKSACRRAGLAGRLVHDLRRSAVRNLDRAGVPRTVAMRLTGHRTESMFSRYNVVDASDLALAVDKVAAYVDQQPTDPKVVPLRKGAQRTGG